MLVREVLYLRLNSNLKSKIGCKLLSFPNKQHYKLKEAKLKNQGILY